MNVTVQLLDYTNGDDQVNTAIEGGNAPDLIDVRGFGSAICSTATAEDLLPYVERDLGTDAFLPGPLAAMKTDGKLLSLMPSFSLTATLGPSSLLDGQSIKSFSELSNRSSKSILS